MSRHALNCCCSVVQPSNQSARVEHSAAESADVNSMLADITSNPEATDVTSTSPCVDDEENVPLIGATCEVVAVPLQPWKFKMSPVPQVLPSDAILGIEVSHTEPSAPVTALPSPEVVNELEGGIIHLDEPEQVGDLNITIQS